MPDHSAINQFLKSTRTETELQALKLARIYEVDVHDILSRTGTTVWEKWADPLSRLDERERCAYVATVMINHAKNLVRIRKRDWAACPPTLDQELNSARAPQWIDPAIESLFRDEQLRIYRAIAQMKPGKPKDVMVHLAMGFHSDEVQAMLKMTRTNYASQLSRARKQLRSILDLEGPDLGKGGL